MMRTHAAAVVLVLAAGCATNPASRDRCAAIASAPLPGITVAAAAAITDREELPGFCGVRGTIVPNIGFEARLPLAGWNGKYYQSGCGGYCGSVLPDKPGFANTINEALKRGYATITTDAGHRGSIGDPSWADGNTEAVLNYAHASIPRTHAAGTALTRAFYGNPPSRAYFGGCSNGGRMAAMAAQRYPELFDGILGGSGVLNLSQSGGVYGSWVVQANAAADGGRILTQESFAAKIPLLEREIAAQCDGADGVLDGMVAAPRRCAVDIDALPACTNDDTAGCFTQAEKHVLRAWYQGPRNSRGEQLQPGMPPGSERFTGFWFLDPDDGVAIGNQLGGGYAKYLGFEDGAPDDYTARDFDFDRDPERLARNGEVLDALDPDLRAFRDAGGKYLMWHGWGDSLVLPDQSIGYYESVAAELGGYDAVQPFFRLFLLPGHGHCWDTPAPQPDRFDPITILDRWVESGEPPEFIVATSPDAPASGDALLLCPHPQAAGPVTADDGQREPGCGDAPAPGAR